MMDRTGPKLTRPSRQRNLRVYLLIVGVVCLSRSFAFPLAPVQSLGYSSPDDIHSRTVLAYCHNRQSCLVKPSRSPSTRSSRSRLVLGNFGRWEGDDMRWSSKAMRRWRRNVSFSKQPVRNSLITVNVLAFGYQVVNSIRYMITRYPEIWPSQALPLVFDTLMGNTRAVPGFTLDFAHVSVLSRLQPHRYLTAGFLHGSTLHLLLNMNALQRLPGWLEYGLGTVLYLTTYLVAVVAGNAAHTFVNSQLDRTMCLGASGGICGLYGLLYIQLARMGNDAAAWRVLKGMALLVGFGILSPNISNAGHAGGFIGGIILAVLCGPSYRRSYSLRRKNSLSSDIYSQDYRAVLGYDKVPSERGRLPLSVLWLGVIVYIVSQNSLSSIPQMIWRGLSRPGSLSQAF